MLPFGINNSVITITRHWNNIWKLTFSFCVIRFPVPGKPMGKPRLGCYSWGTTAGVLQLCVHTAVVRNVLKVITMYWPKTQFSTIFGPFSAQKRLKNGYRNGWETLERTASTSSSCDKRLWGVSFAPGQASRRVSRARVVVPLGNHGRRWARITSISDFRFDQFFGKIGSIKNCTPLVPIPLQNENENKK